MDARDFLAHIFQSCKGVPVTCNKADGYNSRRWRPGDSIPTGVTYFCISTVHDQARSRVLSRKTEDLVLTYVIVLDDVGTKVLAKLIKLKPSYIIETSPNNFQYGYILAEGIDPARAAALIEALAAAGFTDAGAKRADRIMRVPGSLNDKYDPPFEARIVEWRPELDYTLSELCVGFGVVPTDTVVSAGPQALAEGERDPVFEWLRERGYVLGGPNPRGWYPVRCPQEELHTGEVDHGTDYLPGSPGAFVCLHGHCQAFKTSHLRGWIVDQDPTAEVGVFDRQQVAAIGQKLAAQLGLGSATNSEPGEDPLQRLQAALQAAAGPGSLFHRPPTPIASTSLVQRLAAAIGSIFLDPSLLPDADTLPNGNASRTQAVTEPRVHHVMSLIGMSARQNVLTGGVECKFSSYEEYDPVLDTSQGAFEVLIHACVRCGMRGAEAVRQALINYASERRYSPVVEWITSAPWDGHSRLPAFFATIKMRDQALDRWKQVAMRRWLLQGIAAIKNFELLEGPKDVGHVLVLQGEQGVGKSRWVGSVLPDRWVTLGVSLKLDHGERDAVKRVTSTPLTELGEIDGSFRRSDTASLKNFLTARMDIYRPPYGRIEVARPRGTFFAATVNPEGFLLDQTGERRFWPLAVASCDWMHGIDLQQLWAEVWVLYAAGEPFWLQPGEIELHKAAAESHHVESDVAFAIEDLKVRRDAYTDLSIWVHANAKELARHYNMKNNGTVAFADINTALARAGFSRHIATGGRRGWLLPPYEQSLTPAQIAGFKVILGGPK